MAEWPQPLPAPRRRGALLLVALALFVAAGGWWGMQTWSSRWTPDQARWPTQGVAMDATNGPVDWAALSRQGIDFVYIDATDGADTASADFTVQHDAALAAGLKVGAIHHFDVCAMASEQAAAFVTLVPREADALPAAVMVDFDDDCARRPTKALLVTELTTFLTQVETHMGKVALIGPASDVEAEYAVADAVERPLWLRSNRVEPGPEQPQWVIWQANDAATVDGVTGLARRLVANDDAGVNGDGQ